MSGDTSSLPKNNCSQKDPKLLHLEKINVECWHSHHRDAQNYYNLKKINGVEWSGTQ
jgi:hypothetical protein